MALLRQCSRGMVLLWLCCSLGSILWLPAIAADNCTLEVTEPWKENGTLTVEEGTNVTVAFAILYAPCPENPLFVEIVFSPEDNCRCYSYRFRQSWCCVDCEQSKNNLSCTVSAVVSRRTAHWTLMVETWSYPRRLIRSLSFNVTYPPKITSFTAARNLTEPLSSTSNTELLCSWEEGNPQRSVMIRDLKTGHIATHSPPHFNRSTQVRFIFQGVCHLPSFYACESEGVPDLRIVQLKVLCNITILHEKGQNRSGEDFSSPETNRTCSYPTVWLFVNDANVQIVATLIIIAAFTIGLIIGTVAGVKRAACWKRKDRDTKTEKHLQIEMCLRETDADAAQPSTVAGEGSPGKIDADLQDRDASDGYDIPSLVRPTPVVSSDPAGQFSVAPTVCGAVDVDVDVDGGERHYERMPNHYVNAPVTVHHYELISNLNISVDDQLAQRF